MDKARPESKTPIVKPIQQALQVDDGVLRSLFRYLFKLLIL